MTFSGQFIRRLFSRRKPVVHLYSICWNEEYMLPYFFRHYDEIVDRYVIFDDGSTDKTLEMLNAHPNVEVRPLPRSERDSYVLSAKQIHDHAWKESRGQADWVILTAMDEHLYHRDLAGYIARCQRKGITAVPAIGYQMLSATMPHANERMCRLVTRGAPFRRMNKLSLFRPDAVEEMDSGPGRHWAQARGNVVYPERDELLILHYKYLSLEWLSRRHMELEAKLGRKDKENEWGMEYAWTMERLRQEWARFESKAVENVMEQHERNGSPEGEKPWWRK